MSKAEGNARTAMASIVMATILSAIAAIMLGVNHSQAWALLFWGLSIVGCIAAWVVYRRYSSLRAVRWRAELSKNERELGDMFEQVRATDTADDVPPAHAAPTAGTKGPNLS